MSHPFDVLEARAVNDGKQAAREQVCAMVSAMAPSPAGTVTDSTGLREELGYDSLRMMELALALELGFSLPPIDIEATIGVATVGDVVRLVAESLPGPPGPSARPEGTSHD
jgi:acyl carrier protein